MVRSLGVTVCLCMNRLAAFQSLSGVKLHNTGDVHDNDIKTFFIQSRGTGIVSHQVTGVLMERSVHGGKCCWLMTSKN